MTYHLSPLRYGIWCSCTVDIHLAGYVYSYTTILTIFNLTTFYQRYMNLLNSYKTKMQACYYSSFPWIKGRKATHTTSVCFRMWRYVSTTGECGVKYFNFIHLENCFKIDTLWAPTFYLTIWTIFFWRKRLWCAKAIKPLMHVKIRSSTVLPDGLSGYQPNF